MDRAKRYERMMKAHGIHQSQTGSSSIRDTPIPSPRSKGSPATGSSKKRKLDQFTDTNSNIAEDDDEGLNRIKPEPSKAVKAETVKEEPAAAEVSVDSASTFQHCQGFDGTDDGSIFNDFLYFGGSTNQGDISDATFGSAYAAVESPGLSMNMTPVISNGPQATFDGGFPTTGSGMSMTPDSFNGYQATFDNGFVSKRSNMSVTPSISDGPQAGFNSEYATNGSNAMRMSMSSSNSNVERLARPESILIQD